MNEPKVNPDFDKWIILLGRGFVALCGLVVIAIVCIALLFLQIGFEKDYRFSKMTWQTKTLPPTDIMTIGIYEGNAKDLFSLREEYLSLNGYYGIAPPKSFPPIMGQDIYLNQTKSPEVIKTGMSYRVNQVVLLEAVPKNDNEYHKTFLKEATIQNIVSNDYESNVVLTGNQEVIGKRLITGVDYVAKQPVFYKNLTNFVLISKAFAISLLCLIAYLTFRYRKKLNLFEKIIITMASGVLFFYIFTTTKVYFQLIS